MSAQSLLVSRRAALGSAASLGGLAFLAGRAHGETAPPQPDVAPAAGTVLGLWSRIGLSSGDATVSLLELDTQARPRGGLAELRIPAARLSSIDAVHRAGHALAVGYLAPRWGVAESQCRIAGSVITDRSGTREARLLQWTDFG